MSEWDPGAAASEVEIVATGAPRPRRVLTTAVALVLAAGIAAAGFALSAGSERPADDRLAAVQAQLASVESYRLDVVTAMVMGSPDGTGPGTASIMRTHATVAVAGPDAWHSVSDSGDWADEVIHLGDTLWERHADRADALPGELWVELPADTYELSDEEWESLVEEGEDGGVDAVLGGLWFGADPAETTQLIMDARDPVVVADGPDGTTLGLTAPEVPGMGEVDIELELDIDALDRPRALRIRSAADDTSLDVTITFTAWDVAVELSPPAADDIDRTPWLDEDALLAYDASAVLRPADLPDGYELTSIDVWEGDEEWDECPQVVLDHGKVPSEPLADVDELDEWMVQSMDEFLTVTSVATDCAERSEIALSWGGATREVVVGDTTVLVEASLSAEELDRIVASLVPVDLPALVEPFNARQAELEELGLGAGWRWGL